MVKFGYPNTLVGETLHWSLLVRPQQATLGAMVAVCREAALAFDSLSAAAFSDLQAMTQGIRRVLDGTFAPDKLNYVMLMMVDPDVHFHVLPRYATERFWNGGRYQDPYWPKPVDLTQPPPATPDIAALTAFLRARW
jgi:diadenosine tetraphosphate (Ap4A) HIT family hydrolase